CDKSFRRRPFARCTDLAHDCREKRMQFTTARGRIEPNITVARCFTERRNAQSLCQEPSKGTGGGTFKPCHRNGAPSGGGIEQRTCLGDHAIEFRKYTRRALSCGIQPILQEGKRLEDRWSYLLACVSGIVQPPSGFCKCRLRTGRHARHWLAESLFQI